MLSQTARPYIDASVPVLREHGAAITTQFYTTLFEDHPELMHIFNMGNQANGSQQQSLAAAVYAYAANIDNAAALTPVLTRITHKHASIGIKPEHYPIVGRHLLAAIQTILGEAATPALLAAWDEAYGLLATQLIAMEKQLYVQADIEAGDLRPLKVIAVSQESETVRSYYLQTQDSQSPGDFKPGQYVSIAVQLGPLRQLRQYSLSDSPDQPWWRISVKRVSGTALTQSGQVSNWLHANVKVGDQLLAGAAFGDFAPTLESDIPITLISAGIGITPMISVLNTLNERRPARPVVFAYATQHGRHHALREDLTIARTKQSGLKEIIFYEAPLSTDEIGQDYHHQGRMQLEGLLDEETLKGEFYLCGPVGFMQQQWQELLEAGVSPKQIQREVFGPDLLDHLA
ncbi:globin domain-containing protein [Chitinimonas sp. BJB300]|uniref:globin domain-containing protein n=1 Tax=Chitinimonas sp. BJB300 TaxID=1559339 RepID=UPI000C10E365|nr:globin domain-containing protein [Chitinimonas sp. BJB300]PHV11352.1 NO-inducible flavohemoprotein [Chitinimonas sp. BJB300]TSJ87474.1 flavohemoprotein [Chitinimonas sp. BJB300]